MQRYRASFLCLCLCLCVWINSVAGASVAEVKAVLTWNAPTTNVDGTPLTDACCFTVYWKEHDATAWQHSVDIPWEQTTYTVEGLVRGTSYDFYVIARDQAGNKSEPSSTVTTRFPESVDITPPETIRVVQCEKILTLEDGTRLTIVCD